MPVNLRTHAHGQGYTDLNFVIPELISRVDYWKGPYYAEIGDFASAGGAQMRLHRPAEAGHRAGHAGRLRLPARAARRLAGARAGRR